MGKWKKAKNRAAAHEKEPLLAKLSVILLLGNGFLWAGLRGLDVVVLTFLSALLALTGLFIAHVARKQIRRHRGSVGGESVALIGYWGNLLVFLLVFLLFSYSLAIGILRGDFLI